jgi:probable F420-dependent oxidoreductase
MPVTLGLFLMNAYACAEPAGAARVAGLAEALGYDSLWVADHVALPSPRVDPSPLDPADPLLDPVVALTHLAAHTQRIALGTGCVVLPQRNPVVLAKQLASVDVISGGRLIFGLAVGYLEPELRAVGVPMAGRGARTDEYLAAMRALWYDDEPAFHGVHVSFADVDSRPRPLQHRVPVVVGGHSAAAHRRAAIGADGWFGFLLGLRAAAAQIDALRVASATSGRQGPALHISVAPSRPLDPGVVGAYADLGVDRLIVVPPPGLALADLEGFVEDHAPRRIGARPCESPGEPSAAAG